MVHAPSIAAVLLGTVSLFYVDAAPAFRSTFKLPCIVFYRGRPPIATNCLADINSAKGIIVETVTTKNGREFIIENDNSDQNHWYLDHQPAMISDQPNTCYETQEVKLCL